MDPHDWVDDGNGRCETCGEPEPGVPTSFCDFCSRRIVMSDDGIWVDIDKKASGCSDSFDQGGNGEHEPF